MAAVDEERAELLGDDECPPQVTEDWCRRTFGDPLTMVIDIVLAIPFFWFMFFAIVPDNIFYPCLYAIIGLMILWRIYRAYTFVDEEANEKTPYTCGIVKSNGKTMFLIATIHISPKSPIDVEDVIEGSSPDTVMIELDDERLDKMRDPVEGAKMPTQPRQEDLQSIEISRPGQATYTVYGQRAMWNGEQAGIEIAGQLVYEKDNMYGLKTPEKSVANKLCLVHRGGPEGEFAPFAYKAHVAARAGAQALLYVSQDDKLPLNRFGNGTMWGDVKTAMKSYSCGFPPIPGILVSKSDGQKLLDAVENDASIDARLTVREDHYPRRTLRRRLCQGCALMFSGIGILYGVIQCFSVEVGGEFLAAEIAAKAKGLPCLCIDSDINRFWQRLLECLMPTPQNLLDALLAWLAFPRIFFQALFPPRSNIDVVGSIFLHAKSFPLRTWLAFIIAGWCASTVTSHILQGFSNGAEIAAEKTGAVKREDRFVMQTYFALLIQMYMLPRVYYAVAATRDEVMYRSIVSKGRKNASSRMVVVVGAGHANGIMQRARTLGL